MAQSIVSYVDSTLDNAKMGPIHRQVLALITFAYFFDVIDFMQFIGGAYVWPIGTAFALYFRDFFGWWGVWIAIGIGGLVVFLFSFALPESPRWLVTHGRGEHALSLLDRIGLGRPKEQLV